MVREMLRIEKAPVFSAGAFLAKLFMITYEIKYILWVQV
jgi:hypothetical protein